MAVFSLAAQHRNRLFLARAGSREAALSSPSEAAPGVTSSGFGCRIAAAYEQRSQTGLCLYYFSVEAGGLVGLKQPQHPEQEPSLAAACEGGVTRTCSPEHPHHQGLGWGGGDRWQQGRTRCRLRRHRSCCRDGGGSGVWHSASWELCRKRSFIFSL